MFKLFLHDLAVGDLLQEVIRELPAIADPAAHGGDNGALGRADDPDDADLHGL